MMRWRPSLLVQYRLVLLLDLQLLSTCPASTTGGAGFRRRGFGLERDRSYRVPKLSPISEPPRRRVIRGSASATNNVPPPPSADPESVWNPHKGFSVELDKGKHAATPTTDANSADFPLYSVNFVKYPAPNVDLEPGSKQPLEFCQRWPWTSPMHALFKWRRNLIGGKVDVILRQLRDPFGTPSMDQPVLWDTVRYDKPLHRFNNIWFTLSPFIRVKHEKFTKLSHEPVELRKISLLRRAMRWLTPNDMYLRRFEGFTADAVPAGTKKLKSIWRCYRTLIELPKTLRTGHFVLTVENLPYDDRPFVAGPHFFPVVSRASADSTSDNFIDIFNRHSKYDKVARILHANISPSNDLDISMAFTNGRGFRLKLIFEFPRSQLIGELDLRITSAEDERELLNLEVKMKGLDFVVYVRDERTQNATVERDPDSNIVTLLCKFRTESWMRGKVKFYSTLKKRSENNVMGRTTTYAYGDEYAIE